jgi:hypothetical protein
VVKALPHLVPAVFSELIQQHRPLLVLSNHTYTLSDLQVSPALTFPKVFDVILISTWDTLFPGAHVLTLSLICTQMTLFQTPPPQCPKWSRPHGSLLITALLL